jgi:hypothetical protein
MWWAGGAAGSLLAASHILKRGEEHKIILAGVLMPALVKALRLASAIRDYARAARFKNIQGEFRRLACIWSSKELPAFEMEARKAFLRR